MAGTPPSTGTASCHERRTAATNPGRVMCGRAFPPSLRDFRKQRTAPSTRRELPPRKARRAGGRSMGLRRRMALVAVTVAATPLVLGGCTTERKPAVRPAEQVVPSPELTLTPADRSRNVPLSAEVVPLVTGGKITAVRIVDDTGTLVRAEPREDGSAWVPTAPLRPQHTYTAAVTATADSGRTTTRTTTFTTAAASTKPQVTSTLYFADKQTYGTAMPVTLGFRSAHRQGGPRRRAASIVRHHEPAAAGRLVLGGRRQPGLLPRSRLLAAGHDHQCPGRPGGSADRPGTASVTPTAPRRPGSDGRWRSRSTTPPSRCACCGTAS